ncbi:unnamed protein product [Lampetra planeri]
MARRPRRRSRRPGSSANAKIDDVNGNSLVGGRARPSQPWPTINTVQRQRRSDFKHGNTGARPRRKSIPRHNPEGDGNSRRVPARTQAGVDPDSSTRATDGGGGDARGLLVQRRGGSERRWIVAHLSRSSLPLRVVNVPLAGSPGRMQCGKLQTLPSVQDGVGPLRATELNHGTDVYHRRMPSSRARGPSRDRFPCHICHGNTLPLLGSPGEHTSRQTLCCCPSASAGAVGGRGPLIVAELTGRVNSALLKV